ncbi:MAG: hypothetical protein ACMG6S_36155 [Byssovorax sp.]
MNPLTRWSLWLVASGAFALGAATVAGACTPAPDTIDLGTGGGGGGSGGGDGTGGAAPNHGKELFAALEADLYKACGSCHDAGGIADTPFLAGPDIYATIVSWPGLVVKDAKESTLLTYPVAGPQHTYKKLDSAMYKDTLYPAVEAWLVEEGKNIVTTSATKDAGKYIPPFAPIIGFNAVYIDALGAEYTGMALTFTAVLLGDHVIELDDLQVHPTAALGVHLVHPLFSVYPIGKEPDPDPVDSLSNIDQSFEAGQAGTLGPGTLILTNWQLGAKLAVAFQSIESISLPVTDGGADGGITGGCKDVASFGANAAALLKQSCQNCHGGNNPQAKGALDMSSLASDEAAACSQVKNRVSPANVGSSQLFITTDPGGNAAHPFKFGGNDANFNAFKQSVSKWISAEK